MRSSPCLIQLRRHRAPVSPQPGRRLLFLHHAPCITRFASLISRPPHLLKIAIYARYPPSTNPKIPSSHDTRSITNPAGSKLSLSSCILVLLYRCSPAKISSTPPTVEIIPSHVVRPGVTEVYPSTFMNSRRAIENRPTANPNTMVAIPVRNHAR